MRPITLKGFRRFLLLTFTLLTLSGILVHFTNLNHELWYDESGQFWISLGNSHTQPDAGRYPLISALDSNRRNNLDPPLFTLLLRSWINFGLSSTWWLRLLPVILSLITLYYLKKISGRLKLSPLITASLISIAATSHTWFYYSQEVRAYSLCLMLVVMLIYWLLCYHCSSSVKSLFVIFCLLILGMLSLYGFWLLIPPPLFYLLFIVKKNRTLIFLVFLPLLFLAAYFIYQLQLQYQLANGLTIAYLDSYKLNNYPLWQLPSAAFRLLTQSFLYSIDLVEPWGIHVINQSFLNRFSFVLAPLYLTFLRLLSWVFLLLPLVALYLNRHHPPDKKIRLLILFWLSVTIELLLSSFLGLYPLGANRWNLIFTPLTLLLLISCVAGLRRIRLQTLLLTLLLFVSIYNLSRNFINRRQLSHTRSALSQLVSLPAHFYLVSCQPAPTLKYELRQKIASGQTVFVNQATCDDGKSLQSLADYLSSLSVFPAFVISASPPEFSASASALINSRLSALKINYRTVSSTDTRIIVPSH